MARKRKEDAERTRRRILASALSLFVRKGYERTTFTDIAERLKMTKGAVYWHFESKERLLVELVDEALVKFRRKIDETMPSGELTFPKVADMMVRAAQRVVENAKDAAFFRLMKCQIRWSDDSMAKVREDLLANEKCGPMTAFRNAVAADIAAGRARAGVDADEVAVVSVALWDGIVQARIDRFLSRDMEQTLRHAYEAIWNRIRTKESSNG